LRNTASLHSARQKFLSLHMRKVLEWGPSTEAWVPNLFQMSGRTLARKGKESVLAATGYREKRATGGCGCQGAVGSWAMPRLVSYSLAGYEPRRAEHAYQFEISVSSLRASNTRIPVVLFSYGQLAPEIATLCNRFGVMVAEQGTYRHRLAGMSPNSADAMALYPLLHKNLNFAELAAAGAGQVLCCDLDTIFRFDVDALFERYAGPDVVAREEVYSRRSIHGVDNAFIDEPLLNRLAVHLGRAVIPPFNLGAVLYNNGVVARLTGVMATFVDDAWRLMSGLTVCGFPNSDVAGSASFPWMTDVRRFVSDRDRQRALPFPSNNGWIIDEVAWWLTLGSVPGLTRADFAPRDVAQNGEMLGTPLDRSTWALCHYYSHNLTRVIEWLRHPTSSPRNGPPPHPPHDQGRAATPPAAPAR
jgi:hypothetical protein